MKTAGGKKKVNDDGSINKSFEPLLQRNFTLVTTINMKQRHGSDSPAHWPVTTFLRHEV